MRRTTYGILAILLAGGTQSAAQPSHSAAAAAAASASCAIDLANPIVIPPDRPGAASKRAWRLADGSVVFAGRVTVDADGAPRAYNPSNTGLDFLGNAGKPGNWFGVVTDTGKPNGKPIVQGADDPAPGFFVSATAMTNPAVGNRRKQRNYVDSSTIPYVALSPLIARIEGNQGRLAMVARLSGDGVAQPAIQADQAPRSGIGEASIELTQRLGLNPSPKVGGTGSRDFLYLVLPPTERAGFPADAAAVETAAQAAFARWGGAARLAACRTAVTAAPR